MTELIQKVRHKSEFETQRIDLLQEKKRLEKEVFDQKITAHNEQVDVEALEGFSVKNLILKATGKYEERKEQEQREARTAHSRYSFSVARLENIELQLRQVDLALSELSGCEDALSAALQEARGDNPCAEEERIFRMLDAAVQVGTALEETGKSLQDALDTAQSWLGTKPGIYAAVEVMHQAEKQAQEQLNAYMEQLNVLQQRLTELESPLDIPQYNRFDRDYLLGILTGYVVSNHFLDVQQMLIQVDRRWRNLQPSLRQRLRNAHIAWMQALCCAGMA